MKLLKLLVISAVAVSCGSNYEDTSGLVSNAGQLLNNGLLENTVTIDSVSNINSSNVNSYNLSGTCSPDNYSVSISLDSETNSATCTSGVWSISAWDLSAVADDSSVAVSVDLLDAESAVLFSASGTLEKDVVAPSLTMAVAVDINSSNVSTYSLSGTCDEEGGVVNILLGSSSSSTSCSSGTWGISNWDVSAESDGVGILVSADLADAAGNNATQATDSVDKDAVAPLVEITSPADAGYINSSSDSASFAVGGTCNKNGETVDVKVDGVSASSQVGFVCDGANFSGTIDSTGISDAAVVFTAELTKDSVTGVSSNINLTKDTVVPTFAITAAATINSLNVTSYSVFGTCNEDGAISLDIGGVSASGNCSANAWSVTGINVSAASDGASVAVLADMSDLAGNSGTQQSTNIIKDTVLPIIAITAAADINGSNHESYSVVGTCDEDGQVVTVDIAGLSFTPSCSGGSFTTGSVDVSSLTDAASIAITVDMNDASGNPATQAVDSVSKDVAIPTVTIAISPDISQANLTSFVTSGTCSENGRTVVVNIGSINVNPNCSSGTWSSGFVDVTSLTDGTVTITADHDNIDATPAVQASVDVNKDVAAPTVTISSAASITSANELTYIASGTCSESTRAVVVYIDTLNFNPTCSGSNTWTTGFIDVSSIPDGSGISVTADHDNASSQNAVQATLSVNKATSTPTVASLSVSTTLTESADIAWNLNDPGGFIIDDYAVNYRVKGTSTWLNFADGVSTIKNTSVTSLSASTTYEFRVAVKYDTTEQSAWSNIAEGETQPDSPIFGANKAMNVGGATSSTVVAHEDSTSVTLNGVALTTLNKGQSHTFASTIFDVIDADKPIYTAGRRGSGGDVSKGNMVWSPTAWAGKAFSFNTIRYNPQKLEVYAIEAAYVEIKQGATVVAFATIPANSGMTLTWSVYGSFQVVSTGSILAFHYSNSGGSYVDPKPILPSAYELIGIPSRSMRLTADLDGTNFTALHSDSHAESGSLSKTSVATYNARGTLSYYREQSMLFSADKKVSGAAFADSNGGCATPFLPTNLMKKKYVINVAATYVAFASKQGGTIQVLDQTDTVIETLTLSRSGANPNAPYKARRGSTTAGYRFVATVPVFAVYEPSNDTGGADNDETIMYGTD